MDKQKEELMNDLNQPVETADVKAPKSHFNWKRSLITIIFVLFSAAIVGGTVWYLMNKNANDIKASNDKSVQALEKTINDLKAEITNLESKKTTAATTTNGTVSTSTVIKITELGIQFIADKTISDLYYSTSTSDSVGFSTRTLAAYGSACSAIGQPLGLVSVTTQAPIDSSDPNYIPTRSASALIKQVGGKYVYYNHAQSTCSDNTTANKLQTSQSNALKSSLSSITLI